MIRRLLISLLILATLTFAQSPFPGRLPTDDDLLWALDDAQGTLAVDMTTLSSTITLTSSWKNGARFPEAVTVDSETIKICGADFSKLGTVLTVCSGGRAIGWAPAARHFKGAAVSANIIAIHHNALKDLLIAVTGSLGANLSKVVTQGGDGASTGQVLTWNGTKWVPQTATGGVSSVFGRSGAVSAAVGDYSFSQISGSLSSTQIPTGIDAAKIGTGAVTTTKFNYLANVTSDIQAQLAALGSGTVSLMNLPVGDYSSRMTAGSYTINTSGSAGSVAWAAVTGKPTGVGYFTNDAGYLTAGTVPVQSWLSLTNRPTIPTLVSQLTNDLGFLTSASISSLNWTQINGRPTGLLAFQNDAGYLTVNNVPAQEWASILNRPTIPTVPTVVSAFTNDVPYLTATSIPAPDWSVITGKPTIPTQTSQLTNNSGFLTSVPAQSWASITGKPAIPTLTSQLTNDSGFLTSVGTITWASVTGKPTVVSAWTNDAGYLTSVPAQSWASVTGKPTAVSAWTNDAGYLTSVPAQAWTSITGKPTIPTLVSQLSNDLGFQTSVGNVATVGTYTPAKIANAYAHDASWTWQDNNNALPLTLTAIQQGVFAAKAAQATITSVTCWADTNDAVMQLRRSDGSDMISGNITCTVAGASSSSLVNAVVSTGQYVGMYLVSGTAKRVNVVVNYTTAY
jgi:hypothetical protein